MKRSIAIFTVLALCCCRDNTMPESPYPIIDLANARHENIPMSRLFSSIEYVRLETAPECLIDGKLMSTSVTEDYILIVDIFTEQPSILLFDRATGKFIKRIGSYGRGPGEYLELAYCFFDDEERVLYIRRNDDWMGIDIETEERTYVLKPKNMERRVASYSYSYQPFTWLFPLKEGAFMTPMSNITGTDSVRLAVFDSEGTIIRTYPNYRTFIPEAGRQSLHPINARLYYRGDELYFHELYDDTVHLVTPAGLKPHLVFDTDGRKRPHDPSLIVPNTDYYWVSLTKETDDYVFFDYFYGHAGKGSYYIGYYDKRKNRTFTSTPATGWYESVYKNDIDGLFDLTGFNINSRDEIYKRISALDIVEFMENSTQTGLVADNLREVKEDDNPVIMIVKLR